MIRKLANILRDNIALVEWIDNAGGVVDTLRKGDKVFPGWLNGFQHVDMTPNSQKYRGVAFFHASETSEGESNGHLINETAILKLLVWYKAKEIGATVDDSIPALQVADAIPKVVRQDGLTARITYTGTSRDENELSTYTFNENKLFTTYPYGFFVLEYNVSLWYNRCWTGMSSGGTC